MSAAPPARQRGRLLGSDALRAVATVWVVVIHASAWGVGGGYAATNTIARFSVPVFTVLTGVLLAYRYGEVPLGSDFARRRLARTAVPWIIWIPVYVIFDIRVVGNLHGTASSIGPFLAQGGGHLWYLLLIPELYLVFALMPRRHPLIVAGASLVVQTGLCVWRLLGGFPQPWVATLILQYGFLLFPFWIGYFATGLALGRLWRPVPEWLRRTVLLLGPFAILGSGYLLVNINFAGTQNVRFIAGTGAFLNPLLPLLVFSISAWVLSAGPALMRRSALLRRVVKPVADYSLGIYILHPIGLWYLGISYGSNLKDAPLLSVLWFLAILAGAFCFGLAGARIVAASPFAAAIGMSRRPLRRRSAQPAPA